MTERAILDEKMFVILVGLPGAAEADMLLWMLEQGQPETVVQ